MPKPFTPFEFEPQISLEEIERRQKFLLSCIRSKKITLSWHNSYTSMLEGAFARGDRRLCDVLETAYNMGLHFDGWDEYFDPEKWVQAFQKCGVSYEFYVNRFRDFEEILPWDHLDYGVTKKFFTNENKKAHEAVTTKNCRQECAACGAACYGEGVCFARR